MPRRVPGGLIQAASPLTDPGPLVAERDLDMIEEVRGVWPFHRGRRPDSYHPMAEQMP